MIIDIKVAGQNAVMPKKMSIVAGSVNDHEVNFTFDASWDGIAKSVQFSNGAVHKEKLLVDNKTLIPPEVMVDCGYLYIRPYAVLLDETGDILERKKTAMAVVVTVTKDGLIDQSIPYPQTPTMYEQVMGIATQARTDAEQAKTDAALTAPLRDETLGYRNEAEGFKDETQQIKDSALTEITTAKTGALNGIDTAKNEALEAIDLDETGALNAIGLARAGALEDVGIARTGALQDINVAGNGALNAIDNSKLGAVGAVNDTKNGALNDIGLAKTGALNELDTAKDNAVNGVNTAKTTALDEMNLVKQATEDIKTEMQDSLDDIAGKVNKSEELNDTHIVKVLPNGVKNEFTNENMVQRTKDYVLQSVDVVGMYVNATNLDFAIINKPLDSASYGTSTPTTANRNLVIDGYVIADGYSDNVDRIGKYHSNSNTDMWLGFAKGTTLEQARTALTGKTLTYQLAVPVTVLLPSPITPNTKELVRVSEVTNKLPTGLSTANNKAYGQVNNVVGMYGVNELFPNEAWITPTLLNGWTAETGYTVGYMKDQLGIVHIKGRFKNGTVAQPMFVLPVGYRPSNPLSYHAIYSNYQILNGYVTNSGSVIIASSANNASVHLDSITFKAEA